MGLENVLSRISAGKQLDTSGSSFGKGSGAKKNTIDEIQGALGGLGRHETIYLFWAFMVNEKPMQMRVMLNNRLMVCLKENEIELSHSERTGIVRAVMVGVKGSAYKICKTCLSTGQNLKPDNDNKSGLCENCHGAGKVSVSKREIARSIGVPWSTFHKNKHLYAVYNDLMAFCSVLEGNCFKHFATKEVLQE